MAAPEERLARRNRKPSRLALQLTDAFARSTSGPR